MKNELDMLDDIVEAIIKRYESMLSKFIPCQPGKGEFLEQNLITNFAIEFAKKFPNADIYTEVPFQCWDEKNQKNYWKCRADMFIINGDKGYIIEAKGSQRGDSLFNLIKDDVQRIKSSCLRKSFEEMKAKNKPFPTEIYGIIFADYWGLTQEKKNSNADENKYIKSWNEKDSKIWHGLERINAKQMSFASEKYPYWFLAGIFKLDWNDDTKEVDCIS